MSDNARRKLLKSIAAGGGALVAGKNLPDSWSRPVVDSVMLPAHAQTSNQIYSSNNVQNVMNDQQSGEDSLLAGLARSLVPAAEAQVQEFVRIGCARVVGAMLEFEIFDTSNGPAPGVFSGALPLDMTPAVCSFYTCVGASSPSMRITSIDENEVVIGIGEEPTYVIPSAPDCVVVPYPACEAVIEI